MSWARVLIEGPAGHNYSRYTRGCRCGTCTEASRVYHLERRRAQGVQPKKLGRTHGAIATYNVGCRCGLCREACRRAKAAQRAKRRAA